MKKTPPARGFARRGRHSRFSLPIREQARLCSMVSVGSRLVQGLISLDDPRPRWPPPPLGGSGGTHALPRADRRQCAGRAFRPERGADRPAVRDQAMAQVDPVLAGNDLRSSSRSITSGSVLEVRPSRYASRLTCVSTTIARGDGEGGAEHDVGRLAADSRQGGQGVEVARDLAPCRSTTCRAIAIRFFALARKKPVEWIRASSSAWSALASAGRRGSGRRARGVTMVDPRVGTLGREDRRDQQLVRRRDVAGRTSTSG